MLAAFLGLKSATGTVKPPLSLTAAQSHCEAAYESSAVPEGFKPDPAVRYINDGSATDPVGKSSHNVGFRGYWSTNYGVNTVADCAAKCAANKDCEGFNFWGSKDTFHSSNVPYGTLCHMGSRTITSSSYPGKYCAFTRETVISHPLKWKYTDAKAGQRYGTWTCPGKPYCEPGDEIKSTTTPSKENPSSDWKSCVKQIRLESKSPTTASWTPQRHKILHA